MTESQTKPEPRTRRAILERLKRDGPQDALRMAEGLGISAMAVRQHLYALQEESLVSFREEARPLGRPAKIWGLTADADRFFPDGHAELTLGLLDAMRAAFGEPGMEKLLAARLTAQTASYGERVERSAPVRTRLAALAKLRSEEGYMASVEELEGGAGFLLIENHCPVCAAAKVCQGLCATELTLFQRVLGDDVTVERSDHILAGARRCAYRVAARS